MKPAVIAEPLALGTEVSGGPRQHPGNQVPCKKHSRSIAWHQPHPSKALALQEESEMAPVLTESQRERERDQRDKETMGILLSPNVFIFSHS